MREEGALGRLSGPPHKSRGYLTPIVIEVRQTLRRMLGRAIALALGLAFALALLEGIARVGESRGAGRRPRSPRLALFDPNPNGTGSFRLRPNLRLSAGIEGRTIKVITNMHGMRWREVATEKRPGVFRIAVLGDSVAFGCWARSIERSFPAILERRLGKGFEVLNFGVGGYGFEDELLLLREEVLKFAPDVVLLATFNGNDIRDSFLDTTRYVVRGGSADLAEDALEGKVPPFNQTAPYVDPRPVPPRGRLGRLWSSALVRLVLRATNRDPPYLEFEVSQRFTSYSFWSQSPLPKVALLAVDRSKELLEEMRLLSERNGAAFLIAAIPTAEQVYAIHPVGPRFDISLPQALLAGWALEKDVPLLDLLPIFRETARSTGRRPYLRHDVHFNDFGHRIAGEAMAKWLPNAMASARLARCGRETNSAFEANATGAAGCPD